MANSLVKYRSTSIVNIDVLSFEVPVLSHTYVDGYGCIEFDGCLTRWGKSAFTNNLNLISITLPDSLLEIGDHSFFRCSNLETINV